MNSPRARWLAARTRNAARHGLLIAGAGAIVMIATLLMFVLLPRQADRALSGAIAALPSARDTLALRAQRVHADSRRAQAEAQRTAAQVAMAATLSGATTSADSLALAALQPAVAGDSLLRDLAGHIVRARQAPLVESFRSLADAPGLQRDLPLRAAVQRRRDSIEVLHRDREAYAALSGPDARYASMTARLTAEGAELVALAERSLREQAEAAMSARQAALQQAALRRADSLRLDSLRLDSLRARPLADSAQVADSTLATDPATPLLASGLLPDSLLEVAVRTSTDSVARLDSLLVEAHRFNAALDSTKATLRARMQVHIPPVAMLFASLVLGLAVGFAVALWREIRTPTVGDARELEEITQSRVIVHTGAEGVRLGARLGRLGRRGEAQAAVLTPEADAWPLLHLMLSNIGDVTRQVQLLADRPVVAGAVGLNLASVAARESRATVLVDAAQRAGAVVPLLPASALVKRDDVSTAKDAPWDDRWDATRRMPLGRDASVDLVLPRRTRYDARRRASDDAASPDTASPDKAAPAPLDPLLRQYDFVVFVTDTPVVMAVPPSADIVLCARLGVTPLDWIARVVRHTATSQRRIRAVVLWADDVPLAGTRVAG